MKEVQLILQEEYKDRWEGISVLASRNKLLWTIGEIGEVVDITGEHGDFGAAHQEDRGKDLVEELADILMCYNDILLRYDISSEGLKTACKKEFERNMKRW